MKKYWIIIKNTWDEYATYRLNFILWRVRNVIKFIISFFLWTSLFTAQVSLFGYSQSQMLTYVVLAYLVGNFVFATRTQDIGSEIHEGNLTNILLRPIHYFSYVASRDVSDKLLNFCCTLIELTALIIIFRPPFVIQTQFNILLLFAVAISMSVLLYFFLSALLGLFGFWTSEVWAVRFIFIILLDFLGGNLVPIDIFPAVVSKILLLTPFPYILYFPIKVYLNQLSFGEITTGFSIMFTWTIVLFFVLRFIWHKGLKVYSAVGR